MNLLSICHLFPTTIIDARIGLWYDLFTFNTAP